MVHDPRERAGYSLKVKRGKRKRKTELSEDRESPGGAALARGGRARTCGSRHVVRHRPQLHGVSGRAVTREPINLDVF